MSQVIHCPEYWGEEPAALIMSAIIAELALLATAGALCMGFCISDDD